MFSIFVSGPMHSVLGTPYSVLGTRYPVLRTQYSVSLPNLKLTPEKIKSPFRYLCRLFFIPVGPQYMQQRLHLKRRQVGIDRHQAGHHGADVRASETRARPKLITAAGLRRT